MTIASYRIEGLQARGGLLPAQSLRRDYSDLSTAVAVAVKSVRDPTRDQVRVVHIPSGEVVFQTPNEDAR